MTVESATYISDLNATYPAAGDSLVEGDDHLRLLKTVIKATFPGVTGIVLPTHTELNFVDGVTSAIQTQIDAKIGTASLGLVLIQTQDAATSATIDFTTSINSTYAEYELHIINAVPDGTNKVPWLRTSADAGSNWDVASGDYDYVYSEASVTTNTVANGSTTATKIIMSNTGVETTTAWGGMSAVVRFFNPAGTAHYKRFQWAGSSADSTTAGTLATFTGAGARNATAAINGVRFLFSGNNIVSGTFKLYGVRKT